VVSIHTCPPFAALKKIKHGEHPKNITVCFYTLYCLVLSFCLLNCCGLFKCRCIKLPLCTKSSTRQ
jgi:hypothetical protein